MSVLFKISVKKKKKIMQFLPNKNKKKIKYKTALIYMDKANCSGGLNKLKKTK